MYNRSYNSDTAARNKRTHTLKQQLQLPVTEWARSNGPTQGAVCQEHNILHSPIHLLIACFDCSPLSSVFVLACILNTSKTATHTLVQELAVCLFWAPQTVEQTKKNPSARQLRSPDHPLTHYMLTQSESHKSTNHSAAQPNAGKTDSGATAAEWVLCLEGAYVQQHYIYSLQ